MSGASEIVAVKDRADKGETQNIITPAIIAVTKFIGILKLYYLAVDAQVKGFSFFILVCYQYIVELVVLQYG